MPWLCMVATIQAADLSASHVFLQVTVPIEIDDVAVYDGTMKYKVEVSVFVAEVKTLWLVEVEAIVSAPDMTHAARVGWRLHVLHWRALASRHRHGDVAPGRVGFAEQGLDEDCRRKCALLPWHRKKALVERLPCAAFLPPGLPSIPRRLVHVVHFASIF